MDERTALALEKSIEHWEENERADIPSKVSTGGSACALCDEFVEKKFKVSEGYCIGCPVYKKTGKPDCTGSPWAEAHTSRWKWVDNPSSLEFMTAFREAARAEVEFLESLREPT